MHVPYTEEKILNTDYINASSDLSNQQSHIKTNKI